MCIAERPTIYALLVLLSVSVARADDPPDAARAGEAFRQGIAHFEEERWAEARAAFEEAYRIAPDARVLANIADCFAREGNVPEAVRTYRRFLAEAGSQIDASARRLVERRLDELRSQAADLRVAAEPAGATVLVDGIEVGTAPIEDAVSVAAGEHVVEVRLRGHVTVTRRIRARPGGDLEVAVALAPVSAEPRVEPARVEPPPDRSPPPRERPPQPTPLGRGPLLWTGLAVTAALAIGATVTGTLALSRQAEYEDPATSMARRRELYDDRDTLPILTDVLIYSAIGAGLATAGLFFLAGPTDEGDEQGSLARDRSIRPALRVTSRPLASGGLACDLQLYF